AIKAFVTVEKGSILNERAVILHCRRHLEDFAVPRCIEFRENLPKNPSGKIDRLLLKSADLRSEPAAAKGIGNENM
ncbi:MAG: hypothetical protein WCY54_03460, partial [Syntrophales bacterium]